MTDDIDNQIQHIENMIKIYKENNVPINIYFPCVFFLESLKYGNVTLPKIALHYHDVIIGPINHCPAEPGAPEPAEPDAPLQSSGSRRTRSP